MLAPLALLTLLTGCGAHAFAAGSPTSDAASHLDRGSLVVVVAGHANAPSLTTGVSAASAVDLAVDQGWTVSLVTSDGAPRATPLDDGRGSETEGGRRATRDHVTGAIAAARATTPQTDLLAALDVAGRELSGRPGPRSVVVLDPGLSTTGAVDFTKPGTLDADPQELADTLDYQGVLPHLQDVSVVFQGLGQTVAPQPPLSPVLKTQLRLIWTAVARKSGATEVTAEPAPPAGAPAGDLPQVGVVAVGSGMTCTPLALTFAGGEFTYASDSAAFLDRAAAAEVLRPIARQLVDRNIAVVLQGTYADVGTPDGRRKMSNDRAQSVANALIGLGVPVAQLRVEGLGSAFPGFRADRDASGHLLAPAASVNRTVGARLTGPVTC